MCIGVAKNARCLVAAIKVDFITPYLSMVSKCLISIVFHVPIHNPCSNEKWSVGTGCRTEEQLTIMDEPLSDQELSALRHLAKGSSQQQTSKKDGKFICSDLRYSPSVPSVTPFDAFLTTSLSPKNPAFA